MSTLGEHKVQAAKTEGKADIKSILATIDALEAQVVAGTPVSVDQLARVRAAVTAVGGAA
jgi:hypothetical protein